jgi:hypothetical protein
LNTTFPELDAAVPEAETVEAAVPAGLLLVVTVMLGTTLVAVPLVVPLTTTVAVRVGDVTVSTGLVGPADEVAKSIRLCREYGGKGGKYGR